MFHNDKTRKHATCSRAYGETKHVILQLKQDFDGTRRKVVQAEGLPNRSLNALRLLKADF